MVLRALALLVLVTLSGCRDSGTKEPDTTVPTAPPTSASTTTTAVSYEVPATIDEAYVQKVLSAIDHLEGDIARHVAATRKLDDEFGRYMVALYADGESLQLTQELWSGIASQNFELLRAQPGDPKTTLKRVVTARSNCILVQADRDFFAAFNKPDPPASARYLSLVPLPAERNLDQRNPTPWQVGFDGRYDDAHEPTPEEVCAVSR